jgi:hypothetical protein
MILRPLLSLALLAVLSACASTAPAQPEPKALDWSTVTPATDGSQILAWKTLARHCDAWHKGLEETIDLHYRADGRAEDAFGHSLKVRPEQWKGIVVAARSTPVDAFASLSEVYSSGRTDIPQDKFGQKPRYRYSVTVVDDNTLRFRNTGMLDAGF